MFFMQTDIWALGVCVYEMVALKLPSDVPDIQQLGLNIFHDKVTILKESKTQRWFVLNFKL